MKDENCGIRIDSLYVLRSVRSSLDTSIWIQCGTEEALAKAREAFHRKFQSRSKSLQLLRRVDVEKVNTWTVYTVFAYGDGLVWHCEVTDGRIRKALAQFDDSECELVVYEHVREGEGVLSNGD